jgi:arsenate reductase
MKRFDLHLHLHVAIGYRVLQLLALPLETMDRVVLQAALARIGRS